MEDLNKLTKAELITLVEELQATEVGDAIKQRDEAYAKQGELATKVTDLEHQLANATPDEDVAELERQLQDLTDRLAATEATKGDPRPVVKVAGEQHLIMVPKVRIDGEELTAEQLATRADLLTRLHKDGSAVLRSVKSIQAAKAPAKK